MGSGKWFENHDRIVAENQRDPEPAVFHRDPLESVPRPRRLNQPRTVQERSDSAMTQPFSKPLFRVGFAMGLEELADLCVECHPRQEIGHALFDRLRRILVDVLPAVFVQIIPIPVIDRRLRTPAR